MNEYVKRLNKLEFVITYACTGKCKHCSEGDHTLCGIHIDGKMAADSVRKICALYPIETVMTFGGEPLLHPEAVYLIHAAAKECGVAKRQVITNGYFSKNKETMAAVAKGLSLCGVNDLLLSVDAFHQETIPLEPVMYFAQEVKKWNIPIRLSPAWLVSCEDNNPYNEKTREILSLFDTIHISVGEGNIVFSEGNAARLLREYFQEELPENPYRQNPYDLRCLSFEPDGSVLNDSITQRDIIEILREYRP